MVKASEVSLTLFWNLKHGAAASKHKDEDVHVDHQVVAWHEKSVPSFRLEGRKINVLSVLIISPRPCPGLRIYDSATATIAQPRLARRIESWQYLETEQFDQVS